MNNKRFWILIAVIALVFIFIRVGGMRLALAEDEQIWALSSLAPGGFDFPVIPHPPIPVFLYSIAGLAGVAWMLRLVPLVFSVGILFMAALIARKYHGDRAAIAASLIITVSAWSVLASVQVDMDGSILTLWMLCAMYFFLRGVEAKSVREYAIAGFFCGLGLLSKTGFAVFIVAIVAYLVFLLAIERRALRELLRSGVMFGVAAMLFALFPIGAHLVGSGLAGEVGVHATRYFSGFFQQDWVNVLSILAQAIVLISPLLIGLLAMGVWKFERKDMPFFFVIGTLAFFYLFVTTASYRPFERYWMPMIPFIAIIGGRILGAEKLIRWPRVAAYTLVAFVGMLALSLALRPVLYPLFPKDEYLRRLFSFDWNFLFPFHGASGPLAFFVSFIIVIASFFVCGIFVLLWLRNGKKQWMVSFIVIAVAFNFLLIGELLYSVSTPDMNYASAHVLSFAREEGIVEPLFIYQAIGLAEFNKTGITPRLFFGAQYQNADVARAIENEAGTILLVDFPSASRTSPLWRALETCDIRETVISHGREVGYVFSCQK